MGTYHGSCHCGRVRYEVEADLSHLLRCNCSICFKKGQVHIRISPEQLRITSGEEALTLYQFNKNIAKHYFCADCGIHPFSRPRAAPDLYTINVNTLDDYDLEAEAPEIVTFDGQNWEAAVAAMNAKNTPKS